MIEPILTRCSCIDNTLGGGLPQASLTLIYGEPETGKTTLAMQCAVSCSLQNLRVLYIDCDSTFSAKRLSQVASGRFEEIAELIILMRPKDFREQTAVIDHLSEYITKYFGLVVVDPLTSLYRIKVSESSRKTFQINRELNRQLAILAQIAKVKKIPILITSQVRSLFIESYGSVAPVATRVLKFWADTIIAMKPSENPQTIKAVLEKTLKHQQEVDCYLRISATGIHDDPFQ